MTNGQKESGFKAILLTVDGVVLGKRINEHRNSFNIPEGITFPNIESKTNAASVEASDDGLNYGEITHIDGSFIELIMGKTQLQTGKPLFRG